MNNAELEKKNHDELSELPVYSTFVPMVDYDFITEYKVNELTITWDEAAEIIAFVKMHERDEIPEELWDIIMRLQEAME